MLDLLCVDDLDPLAREVSGTESLAQDLYHRLITPRGRLIDDPDFGIGIDSWLSVPLPASAEDLIERELEKDDRALSVTATLRQPDPETIEIDIEFDSVDGSGAISTVTTRAGTERRAA